MVYNKHDPHSREKNRLYQAKWFKNNKELQRKRIKDLKNKRRSELKSLLDSVKIKCKDCGNTDKRVLEFDHLRDKSFGISSTSYHIKYSIEEIKLEIGKCEVVCVNCHKIRTHNRRELFKIMKKTIKEIYAL